MKILDGMPVLSYGAHSAPEYGACLMEYVSMLAGEPFSDHPRTADITLAHIARACNDAYNTDNTLRQGIAPLAVRLVGTRAAATKFTREQNLVRIGTVDAVQAGLGIWAMRHIAAYIPETLRLDVERFCRDLQKCLAVGITYDAKARAGFLREQVEEAMSGIHWVDPALGAVKSFVSAFTYEGCYSIEGRVAGAVLGAIVTVAKAEGMTRIATGLEAVLDEFDRITGHQLTDTVPEPTQPEPTDPETPVDEPAHIINALQVAEQAHELLLTSYQDQIMKAASTQWITNDAWSIGELVTK